ncbi:hypothetical protein [Streptomyces sp. NPDC102462]|uniref:hypothetical protein n=1 Tax=Streptomyces sp. NPDC102462 TaxID=3366178 RepID=UPI00380F42C9
MESTAKDVAPFGIGVTIIEAGGARTEFRYSSLRMATPLGEYDGTPAAMTRAAKDRSRPSLGSWRWLVASVLGLREAREEKVREEIARLGEEAERVQAALGEAERVLRGLVDARATVAAVLAELPPAAGEPQRGAVAGSVVRHRIDSMTASVLAPDYQRNVSVLEPEAGREGMRCLASGRGSGVPGFRASGGVPAKVEGVQSKAKRLVERGWARHVWAGVLTALVVPAG